MTKICPLCKKYNKINDDNTYHCNFCKDYNIFSNGTMHSFVIEKFIIIDYDLLTYTNVYSAKAEFLFKMPKFIIDEYLDVNVLKQKLNMLVSFL